MFRPTHHDKHIDWKVKGNPINWLSVWRYRNATPLRSCQFSSQSSIVRLKLDLFVAHEHCIFCICVRVWSGTYASYNLPLAFAPLVVFFSFKTLIFSLKNKKAGSFRRRIPYKLTNQYSCNNVGNFKCYCIFVFKCPSTWGKEGYETVFILGKNVEKGK